MSAVSCHFSVILFTFSVDVIVPSHGRSMGMLRVGQENTSMMYLMLARRVGNELRVTWLIQGPTFDEVFVKAGASVLGVLCIFVASGSRFQCGASHFAFWIHSQFGPTQAQEICGVKTDLVIAGAFRSSRQSGALTKEDEAVLNRLRCTDRVDQWLALVGAATRSRMACFWMAVACSQALCWGVDCVHG